MFEDITNNFPYILNSRTSTNWKASQELGNECTKISSKPISLMKSLATKHKYPVVLNEGWRDLLSIYNHMQVCSTSRLNGRK